MRKRCLAAATVLAATVLSSIPSLPVHSCTGIVLNKTKGLVISGRTMDFDTDLGSNICFKPAGSQVSDPNAKFVKEKFEPIAWTTKHDVVLIDAFNEPAFADGMNTEGLSMATLWQNETQPAKETAAGTKGLSNVTLVEYVLENAKNVEEAKKLIGDLSVFLSNYKGMPMVLHWIITDNSGHSVVVELKDGRPKFFDQAEQIGVLTNSPTYDLQMANLKTHMANTSSVDKNGSSSAAACSAQNIATVDYNKIPGDYKPTSRFVKSAYLVSTTPELKTADAGMMTAMQILHNVEVPKGAQDTGSYTQWIVVRDQTNLRYWLVSKDNPIPRFIDLKTLNFKQASAKRIPIESAMAVETNSKMLEISAGSNSSQH